MPRTSRLSPFYLPWTTLTLVARFALPLALWYTLGQLLRFLLMYGGYRLGLTKIGEAVAPIGTLSLLVMLTLCIAVAMMHSVREGLPAILAREDDGELAPWAIGRDDETILDAVGRALLPFMIFYLAWGMFRDDALDFANSASGRGFAEGGFEGQIKGLGMLNTLADHLYIAIGLTVAFFILKFACERILLPRMPRSGGVMLAYCEVNWALFGIFTIEEVRGKASGWFTNREAWGWLRGLAGHAVDQWPTFKFAVLGSLVWLVIAGVILGVDTEDEEAALGQGRAGRGLARISGIRRERTPLEVLTRELREKWLPTWFGLRLVRRAGLLTFGVFCALFMGLEVLKQLTLRGIYVLIGAHDVAWWAIRLTPIDFAVGLVFEALRICLLAAAFNLVVARVSARNAVRRAAPPPHWSATVRSPARPT
jgi:hypothetical protein